MLAGLLETNDTKSMHYIDSLAENQYEQRDQSPFKLDFEVGLAVVNEVGAAEQQADSSDEHVTGLSTQ